MTPRERLTKLLGVEPSETGPVALLLTISFFMGLFLATVSVAAQTVFLTSEGIIESKDLPYALMIGGGFGFLATGLFNLMQGRIPFRYIAVFFLLLIIAATAVLEFGDQYPEIISPKNLHYVGFALILPFTFITNLVFWGAFNRLFTLRQQKKVVGNVDVGMDIAQIIAFFTIPFMLASGLQMQSLFTIGLISIIGFLVLFMILSAKYLGPITRNPQPGMMDEKEHKKLNIFRLLSFKYVAWLAAFIILSFTALRFIDYSFLIVTTQFFDPQGLPIFLSLFEATVVIFGFMFGLFITDRVQEEYGLRVSLILNPLLLLIFTGAAAGLGLVFGYEGEGNVVYFFIAIAMSKLFVNSLRDSLDTPVFKFYYVPIDKSVKLDAQTKLEGIVTATATAIAGGLIVLINQFEIFDLLSITLFTLPLLGLWYLIINRMYSGYRETLQSSLQRNRAQVAGHVVREFTLNSVLEKEVNSTAEEKVIYGLKLMEKLEPALFETSLMKLVNSDLRTVKQFAQAKIEELGLNEQSGSEIAGLAKQAVGASEDSDLLSISPDKLMKLGKSVKQADRLLAAKFLRQMVSQKTIFILLELLRDADPKVRNEAIQTARKVKRPETWPVLIDMLSSPLYSNQATAALKESGAPALQVLDTSFYKSGQSDQVMLKIVQIMGHIGGEAAWQLLWKKSDYPDKRIVKQIFYSLRFTNYTAKGRERNQVIDLLDTEVSKTLWNLNAQEELPEEQHFSFLKQALREELRDNYDQISLLMSILYDPQSVQLVRENVETGTVDGIAYAMELMDLFVDQELKPRLMPIFDDISPKEKMAKLQVYFARESYAPVQVVNYILNRDFNLNNRWTKMCAVYAAAYIPEFRVSRGLIGQMFNPDRLLQETAAWVIFNKDKAQYRVIADRLPLRDKKFLDTAIENNQLLDGLDDGFFLGIEMVMFIKNLPAFAGIPGSILSDLADKIIPVDLRAQDKIVFNNPDENRPILICATGQVRLREGTNEVGIMKKEDVFGDLFQEGPSIKITEVEATERTVMFRINLPDFYFVMAKHHELVQGLVQNVTTKQKSTTRN